MTGKWSTTVGVLLGLTILVCSSDLNAKEGEFGMTLATGTGYVTGSVSGDKAREGSFSLRHPMVLDMDIQYEILGWFAISVKGGATLEQGHTGRIIPGLVFSTADLLTDWVAIYGRVGGLIHLNPSLYGGALGLGFKFQFHDHVGAITEFSFEPMFGSDVKVILPMLWLIGFRANV